MGSWNMMALRAFAPAAFAMVVALVSLWTISGWQDNPYLAAMVSPAKWVPAAALAFAVGHGVWISVRLWRAERGEGLLCGCGGLLGRERDGRYGPYRRCLACSRNVAQRHYE